LNADIKESIFIDLPENQVAGGAEKIAEETAKLKASSEQAKSPTSDKIGLLMK
jgi:hypothetical protein